MVKEYFPKNERNELAITIKKLYKTGMKQIDIAKLFNISKRKVNYLVHNPIILKKKRRRKLIQKEKNLIVRWARDKPINLWSAKKIQNKFNLFPKNKKEKNMPKKISLSTVNKTLNQYLSRPKQMKKVFYLNEKKKEQRLKFLLFMKENSISPDDILHRRKYN